MLNDSNRNGKLWTKPFIVITLCYFLLFICLQMLLSPLPSYVKDRFAPNDVTVSLVTSLFALSAIAARFATAALMKKVHRNVLLFVGLLIAGGATAAYSWADSVTVLLLLRVVFGIGFGIGSTVMPTLVSQIIPPNRIGEGIGYFSLSTSLAMSFGPLIGLSVLGNQGFQPLSLLGAAAALAIIPLLYGSRTIPPQPALKHPASSQPQDKERRPFNKKLLLPALLNALLSVTYGGLLGFLALFGKEVGLEQIGLFFCLTCLPY